MSEQTSNLLHRLQYVSQIATLFFTNKKQRFDGQQQVINLLAVEDGMPQGNLAELMDIRPSSLAELLKKLEQAGAVERREDPTDKRIKRVYLTEMGRKRVIQNADRKQDLSAIFFAGLSQEEQHDFDRLLDKIIEGLPEEYRVRMNQLDPFEKLSEMQRLREEMMDIDWSKLSRHEKHQMRRDMQNRARDMGFDPRNFQRGMARMNPRHPQGFWPNPRPDKKQTSKEDDWTDF